MKEPKDPNNDYLLENEWDYTQDEFYFPFMKICREFKINPNQVFFHSQQNEDKYVIQKLLKEKIEDGVYLEVGAMDGLTYSNTKTLQDHFGFTGIMIEPVEHMYKKLLINRPKDKCYNFAVSNLDQNEVYYIGDNGESGIFDTINTDLNRYSKNWEKYSVKTQKLKNIIKSSGFEYIDFMFIDVEGGECDLLKSFDFSFPVYCIIIEASSKHKEKNKCFIDILKNNNFTYVERLRGNQVWINKNYFRKNLFKEIA